MWVKVEIDDTQNIAIDFSRQIRDEKKFCFKQFFKFEINISNILIREARETSLQCQLLSRCAKYRVT